MDTNFKPNLTKKIVPQFIGNMVLILFCLIILMDNQFNRIIINKIIPTNKEIESIPKYPINSNPNISDPIYVPLKNPCDHIYKLTRVLRLIPTRKWKTDVISETYGPGCSNLMWVVDTDSNAPKSYAGYEFLSVKLSRHQNHTKHVVYTTPDLLNNFEWFIKVDGDTFVVTENLFGFLQYYDSSYPHYLRYALRARWQKDNVVSNYGTCYALSRETIKNIGKYMQYLPSIRPPPSTEH